MNKLLKTIGLVSVISLFTGCAAIGTAVSHGSLQTQTLMSDSIFLSTSANQVPPYNLYHDHELHGSSKLYNRRATDQQIKK